MTRRSRSPTESHNAPPERSRVARGSHTRSCGGAAGGPDRPLDGERQTRAKSRTQDRGACRARRVRRDHLSRPAELDENGDNMAANREFDLILYGATGFVGKLTAEYLAEAAPANARIGL